MRDQFVSQDFAVSGLVANAQAGEAMQAPAAVFLVECYDADGNLKWTEKVHNLVTIEGKTDIIDKYLKGSAYTAAWYCGLKGTGSPAAGDTLASHSGWSELTPYSGNRPAITWGTTSSGSNTSNQVSFSINATATVAGAFTSSVASGTAGVLYNVVDFAVARAVANGDTLNVTITLSVT